MLFPIITKDLSRSFVLCSCRMFRNLLRSASDPIPREHVCFSCLAGVRAQTRLFSRTSLSRSDSQETPEPSQSKGRSSQHTRAASKPKGKSTSNRSTRTASKGKTPIRRTKTVSKDKTSSATSIDNVFQTLTETTARRAKPESPQPQPILESTLNQLVSQLNGGEGSGAGSNAYKFPEPPTQVRKAIVSRTREQASAKKQKTHLQEVQAQTQPPVPQLSYGLERVLFNPGVYQLRDPRTRVHNFDPYLGSIMPVTEFDFAALKDYITSSNDNTLRDVAIKHKRKYIGSTSSMTSVLSHFHYLLSAWRPINTSAVSRGFTETAANYTLVTRAPAAIFLRYRDGVYAIDADKEYDSTNILLSLGKSMEKLLTVPKEQFERYRRSHENKITAAEEQLTPESYHYSMLGDFMMRSQLDAYDPRLPGTGMFDLKTRAVVSIRQHADAPEDGLGYQITSRFGDFESYEREYYDMIRSAFLKYALQVRIGRMDGIFVAFHNISQIFGFQYVCLPEMDQALHGQWDTTLGDTEFRLSIQLWNKVLNRATAKFPNRSLRFHFETRPTDPPYMYIFYEPVKEEEIEAIQNTNKAEIDAMQRRILNLEPEDEPESTVTESSDQNLEDLASEDGSPEPLSEEEQEGKEPGDTSDTAPDTESTAPETQPRELGAMTLTVASRVNGKPVPRPENLTAKDNWVVEFEICDLDGPEVTRWYNACQNRRRVALKGNGRDWRASSSFHRTLKDLAKRGRELRKTQEKLDKKLGMLVLDGVKV
ncbi:mitochondrial protein Pet127-domain-containing protein [Aspergillus granulosus]|uniref:Mitochondrial protein Pet127-domain-containing protein n=1 Tax=Aspergillus granulosus TaxID=176169 RepID=A0ABR4HKA6_9EURO